MAEDAPAQQSPMPGSEAHDSTAVPDSSSLPLPPIAKSSDPGLSSAARKRKRPTPNDEGPAPSADFVPFEFGDSPSNPTSDCASSSSSALTSSTGAGSIGSKNGASEDPANKNQSRTVKSKARKKARRRRKAEDQARANGRADDSGDDGGDSPENQGEALKHGDDSDVDKDALVQRAAADRSGDQQNAEKGRARRDGVGADEMTAKQRKKIRKKEKRRLKKLEAAERAAAFPGGAGGRFDPLPGDQNVSEIGGRARSASISSSSSYHPSSDGGSDSEDDSAPTMPGESVAGAAAAPASNPDPSLAVVSSKPPSPATVLAQQKYFQPFVFPDLYHEEDRPMFSHTTPDIRTTTLVSLSSYSVPLQTSLVVCNVCTFPGHTSSSCPELTCTHCSAKNSHHSHRCPKKAPGSPSSSSSERSTFDWRAIKPHRLLTPDSPATKIRMFCYHCASSGHWGDDCPRLPVPEDPGSFSVEEMKRRGYISQETAQELEEVSDSDPRHRKFGLGALEGEVPPSWDPFEEFKKTPERPINVAVRSAYGGGGGGGGGGGYGSGGRYDGGGGGGRPPRRDGGRDYDRRDGRGRDGGGQSYRPSSYASRDAWNRYQR